MNSRASVILVCAALLSACIWTLVEANQANSTTITIQGQTPGPTAFISKVNLAAAATDSLASIRFTIAPKPGSVTRPVSATYAFGYLRQRGYVDSANGKITVPVFGLYSDYANTVTLTYSFDDGSSRSAARPRVICACRSARRRLISASLATNSRCERDAARRRRERNC